MELAEDVLADNGTHLHRLDALAEETLQLLAADPQHATGHHRLDGGLRRSSIEETWIVGHKLALEREPRNVISSVADASRDILECSTLHVGKPLRRFTLPLQQVAPAERDSLALPFAEVERLLFCKIL